MAVKVTLNSKPQHFVEYEDGEGLEYRDGALLVLVGVSKPVAIHAPGTWVSAKVAK